ncbi:CDP-diacylglycerol--serine O-phosphatidyltransferase [Terasakiella brassicae]|uniref:CDP-diacylglycerol--serine O-phosphatidyltransferase n=1 Tax=Terasakiella brassicae TaxID=1634917 RepID=A0A917BWC6_9PROT|nr:CDP-diacylglycerol--serine O-phosphatidyltransferase [Terasakiella brassicae]GGF60049.1 CDP-diacylglycerol--serine O-phosphatidyltransferase [Terasakiella brassicae]
MEKRRPKLKRLPINHLIPNILTISALCAGMTAINFAARDMWEASVFAIVVAAILDGLDGRVARLLNAQSKFGAELDSLSDFISFGVAPPMILYFWVLENAGRIGWVFVCFFTVCMALRLARFNTALEDPDKQPWENNFFTGVPAPAGALLIMYPLVLSFMFGDDFFRSPAMACFFLTVIGGLMVSRFPTFSFKKAKVPAAYVLPVMIGVGLLVAFLVSAPWAMLSVIGAIYLVSIPLSFNSYKKWQRRAAAGELDEEDDAEIEICEKED